MASLQLQSDAQNLKDLKISTRRPVQGKKSSDRSPSPRHSPVPYASRRNNCRLTTEHCPITNETEHLTPIWDRHSSADRKQAGGRSQSPLAVSGKEQREQRRIRRMLDE
jgi:hypothetical protein